MDEALKRRLVGVLVVAVVVFIISLLLPHPGTVRTDENNQRVTLDLTGKEPESVHVAPTPVPPVIAAAPAAVDKPVADKPVAATSSNDGTPPQIEEPPVTSSLPAESMTDDDEPPAKAQKPAELAAAKPAPPPAKPKSETVVAATTPEKPAPAKPESKPVLKLEDSLKQKPAVAKPDKPVEKVAPKLADKTPAVAAKTAPVPAKTHWFVQVGAFTDIAKARQVLDKLGPKGLKGIISPLDSAKGTLYRARIGPLASRDQAKQAQDQAAKLGFTGSSVVED